MSTTPQFIVIAGASGFGREVQWLAEQIAESRGGIPLAECFVDDDARRIGTMVNGLRVKTLEQAHADHADAALAIAIGSSALREDVARRAAALGASFVTLVHPRVERSKWIEIGEGTIICAGCILTTNIRIGAHVHINLDCTIGHDVVVDDFVTLAPGVHVSGNVRIEAGAYIGTGAAIINGREGEPLVIGANSVIGAGACVTRNVAAGTTAVGVPAKERVK